MAEHLGDRQRLADMAKRMNGLLAQEVHPVLQEMFNLAQQLEPFGGSPRLSADITRFQ